MRMSIALALVAVTVGGTPAQAKPKPKAEAPKEVAKTARAISELANRFTWGMSEADVLKIILDDVNARFDEKIKKERDAFKQDAVRKQLLDAIEQVKQNHVQFDGHKTGWDVSLIDREFGHKTGEAMVVMWEKDQRRFLFFYQGKLWKQFIAFNADHPAFAGKNFDDFAEIMQRRYGTAEVSFKKQRTTDEQTFDHLEWPPAGDYILWAIDMTALYNNFCLSLFQKSVVPLIEKARKDIKQDDDSSTDLVKKALEMDSSNKDPNADVVDDITGRQMPRPAPTPAKTPKKK